MDNFTISEALKILDIQRKNCIDLGSTQAKTSKIFLNDQDTGNKEQNAYYNGFYTMAENIFSSNNYSLGYNPKMGKHYCNKKEY